jgi:hypothetical protein
MTFDDFWKEFYGITVCTLTPDLDEDGRTDDEVNTVRRKKVNRQSCH